MQFTQHDLIRRIVAATQKPRDHGLAGRLRSAPSDVGTCNFCSRQERG